MAIEIAPALEPGEWAKRRAHGISIDKPFGEVHLVVQDPDGEVVSVSGVEELFALVALSLEHLIKRRPKMTQGASRTKRCSH